MAERERRAQERRFQISEALRLPSLPMSQRMSRRLRVRWGGLIKHRLRSARSLNVRHLLRTVKSAITPIIEELSGIATRPRHGCFMAMEAPHSDRVLPLQVTSAITPL